MSHKPLLSHTSAMSYRLSLIHFRHVTYLTHLDTAYQSSQLECHHLSLSLQQDSNPQTLIVRKEKLNYLAKFNHLTLWPVSLNRSVFVYKLSGKGFESHCSHLNFRYHVCFEQGVLWHLGNYRVQIHSKTRMWHDKNTQSSCHSCCIFDCV